LGLSAANVAVCMLLLLMTLVMPSATKGSARWVSIFGISMMPADLMKPGFVIMTAWFLDYLQRISGGNIFSFDKRLWKWDGWPAYLALFGMILLILLRQPDFGTFGLYMAVFGTMIFLAGLPWKLIPVLGGVAAAGGVFAFMTLSHVRGRILSFIGLEGGADTYQVRKSVEAIKSGGLFGSGEDSFVKQSLPDSHTDFIYSAIAEDSGAILAVVLIFGLLFVLKRLSDNAAQTRDRFIFYVAGGVFALFGFQVSINIATAMGLIPTTGMTLPFISYGGSSFLAFCLLFGLLLALVREDRWK
jgi:cell division protein FtsW